MKNKMLLFVILQALSVDSSYAQQEPTTAEIAFQNAWITNTSASSSDEDILVAAMFAQQNQPVFAPRFMQAELASTEHARILASINWYYCRDAANVDFCEDDSLAERLIAIDPNNLEPYLYLMVDLIDAGEVDAALEALSSGNRTIETNSYYLDKMNVLRNRLKSADYPAGRLNWVAEQVTNVLQTYFFHVKLLSICKEKGGESTDWKTQCLELGRRLETSGRTVVENVHGFAIQRDVLTDSDAEQALKADIVERMAAFNHVRDLGNEQLDWWNDPALRPDIFYTDINEFGEIEAVRRALSRLE